MRALPARVQEWQREGELTEVGGDRIFVVTREGTGPPVLLLHGYPSSSYDWRPVLGLLPGRRTTTFDFLGFGLSDKPRDRVYSLHGQADVVEAIARRWTGEQVNVIAHDMGTSVATELLARDIEGRLSFLLGTVLCCSMAAS